MPLDYYFWFTQPAPVIINADRVLAIIFLAFLIASVILAVNRRFLKQPPTDKLAGKFVNLFWVVGLCGLVWFGLRYENTPIFSMRAWAGLIFLIGLVWTCFIIKYLLFGYFKELKEYHHEQLKSRYLPNAKSR